MTTKRSPVPITVAYDPRKSREFKQVVRAIAQDHRPEKLWETPVILTVRVFRRPPSGMSKKKTAAALAGRIVPTTKPDLKNYIAGIEDALEGIVYVNDSQIYRYGEMTGKYYSDTPRVEIILEEIPDWFAFPNECERKKP
jgi:Holliday junction resolvase RusA-like endonuclease